MAPEDEDVSQCSHLLNDPDRLYVSLDDLDALSQAESDPDGMVRRAPRMTIDEVQRTPHLLLAIKRAVDQRRVPGQFVLTGSANLLLMKSVSESLAGRAVYLTLGPLTRSAGRPLRSRGGSLFLRWRGRAPEHDGVGSPDTLERTWSGIFRTSRELRTCRISDASPGRPRYGSGTS